MPTKLPVVIATSGGIAEVVVTAKREPEPEPKPNCGDKFPVLTSSANVGIGPLAVEIGAIFVVDWKSEAVHAYTYRGLGGGISFPLASGAVSFEGGLSKGIDSVEEITSWGFAVSAFAALGAKGFAGQYSSNFSADYHIITGGYAAGLGASFGGIISNTEFDRTYSFNTAPKKVRKFIRGCQKQGN